MKKHYHSSLELGRFRVEIILLGLTVSGFGYGLVKGDLTAIERVAVKSIQSEDGDLIDCIDVYKQPAFHHPALRYHTIQMAPTFDPKMEVEEEGNGQSSMVVTSQVWQRNGNCRKGTIPVRRNQGRELFEPSSQEFYGRKKPRFSGPFTQLNDSVDAQFKQQNHSKAILFTLGYSYSGVKGDMRVWNPNVESDDEYSTSQVSLQSGHYSNFECVEAGWMVNPSLYGDRKTRLFVYWTVDGSRKTGCFDLTCPGFIQTSSEIALGAAIYPISVPYGLPFEITLYIFQDPGTGNWWLQYGEKINIGYWPRSLFNLLYYHAQSAEWGGEIYSSRLGQSPHTATAIGNGHFPDYISGNSGQVKRLRILDNSLVLKKPEWADTYVDEYNCYDADYVQAYLEDPEFYYGGPGRNDLCP